MEIIQGNVTAPKGFQASGVYCGIRKNKEKKDLALIYSKKLCQAAACYTQNKVKGAPILVTQENLQDGVANVVICNSGNANTCNADGVEVAKKICKALADKLDVFPSDIIIASTGVIGQPLNSQAIIDGIPKLIEEMSEEKGIDAATAIMTTDLKEKEIAVEVMIDDVPVRIGGIAKGSGMINPNMATMLCFITSDCAISSKMLQKALKRAVGDSFNMISVDGDTSTNDMVSVMANACAGNLLIDTENEDFEIFADALKFVCINLAKKMAADGEGATKLLECSVIGAKDVKDAKIAAKSVISSSLVKAAMFGADANWGRVLCAIGYAPFDTDITKTDVSFISEKGEILVCKNGSGVDFDEDKAKEILLEKEIIISVNLNEGDCQAKAWGCDLTYDYVKINGDYRT
ncbi:MAG: bifunctional glutamate N-acetyltransferase/amino-acid acetyltransferase ArgJ [Ruminococcaceae bacterium]|nr:bifunctional glutamate N-acetyltransferase/amino-acid acetyltransferase ArgJ [Oscillospiraceae bacterium]